MDFGSFFEKVWLTKGEHIRQFEKKMASAPPCILDVLGTGNSGRVRMPKTTQETQKKMASAPPCVLYVLGTWTSGRVQMPKNKSSYSN
jgi:hypothetical protein